MRRGECRSIAHRDLSDRELRDTAAVDEIDERPRTHDRREHRGDDADREGDREALHRPGADGIEDDRDEEGRDVRVENRDEGAIEAGIDRLLRRPRRELLPDAGEKSAPRPRPCRP